MQTLLISIHSYVVCPSLPSPPPPLPPLPLRIIVSAVQYTGTNLCTFSHKAPVKSVAFATGETMALAAQNRVGKTPSRIFIYNISEDSKEQDLESVLELDNPTLEHNFTKAMWSRLNSHIYTSDEGGVVSVWDVETATAVHSLQAHKKRINSMTASIDKNLLLTASSDMTAKLIDTRLDRPIDVSNPADQHFIDIRTFQLDRPINCCALSPILNHAMFAGGQEAIDVTLSSNKEGKFETDFFHVVYGEKLASLKGHFGPVNTMAVSPNGKMFATGGEDGIVRLHHFDQGYLSSTY